MPLNVSCCRYGAASIKAAAKHGPAGLGCTTGCRGGGKLLSKIPEGLGFSLLATTAALIFHPEAAVLCSSVCQKVKASSCP